MKLILPILFRRKRRYRTTGYTSSFASRSHSHITLPGLPKMSMPSLPGCGCGLMVLIPIVVLLMALWCLWYFVPVGQNEQHRVALNVIAETRYVVCSDTTELFAFNTSRGDTLFTGVTSIEADNDSLAQFYTPGAIREVLPARWIRRYDLLPYNGNIMAVEPFDTASVCRLSSKTIVGILQREAEHIWSSQQVIKEQDADVAYFLRTHTVVDNGFDIVERYGKELSAASDSIRKAALLVQEALKHNNLRIRLDRRYYIKVGKDRTECLPVQQKDGVLMLQLQPLHITDTTWHKPSPEDSSLYIRYVSRTRLSAHAASKLVKKPDTGNTKQYLSAIDSLGTYKGDRDSIGQPHGYGRFLSLDGDFYEGEWSHGERSGVGFSMIPGKRLRLGEWKADRFLGERVVYTPQRIYGIDISRFQHERGRKRYYINWKNLRVTSLGHMSKKTVQGKVNYPVSFIFIKVTEGATVVSKYYLSDYANARRYGYKTGAYHFFSILTPGRNQAINFLRHSRYRSGDLPPVLDLEPSDAQIRKAGGIGKVFRNVRAWLNAVEYQRKVRPILYVGQRFINKWMPYAPDLLKNYDVWIARYGEYKPNVRLAFWQLCPDGHVSGITPTVDINVYNGFKLP